MRISIEGNIGSGKTTYLNIIKNKGYNVYCENVHNKLWINLLEKYNSNMNRYALSIQMNSLLDKITLPYISNEINIYERSPYNVTHVFGSLLYENNIYDPDEYNLECKYSEKFGWIPDKIIYLQCDPDICFKRIQSRLVSGDNKITRDYINLLHCKHENIYNDLTKSHLLSNTQIYILNTNNDIDINKNINNIMKIISN